MIKTFTLTIFFVFYAFAAVFGQAPVIASYIPASGPVGSIITLRGDHFNTLKQKNIVFFGPVRAEVLSSSPTQLTVKVPVSANFRCRRCRPCPEDRAGRKRFYTDQQSQWTAFPGKHSDRCRWKFLCRRRPR